MNSSPRRIPSEDDYQTLLLGLWVCLHVHGPAPAIRTIRKFLQRKAALKCLNKSFEIS